ncbi:MAG TPA: hypothetical protein VJJ83_01450 [Candidatus Babeliales bacterium]|nr:hypothetical protein [Candidatus Babeliales bacterium]
MLSHRLTLALITAITALTVSYDAIALDKAVRGWTKYHDRAPRYGTDQCDQNHSNWPSLCSPVVSSPRAQTPRYLHSYAESKRATENADPHEQFDLTMILSPTARRKLQITPVAPSIKPDLAPLASHETAETLADLAAGRLLVTRDLPEIIQRLRLAERIPVERHDVRRLLAQKLALPDSQWTWPHVGAALEYRCPHYVFPNPMRRFNQASAEAKLAAMRAPDALTRIAALDAVLTGGCQLPLGIGEVPLAIESGIVLMTLARRLTKDDQQRLHDLQWAVGGSHLILSQSAQPSWRVCDHHVRAVTGQFLQQRFIAYRTAEVATIAATATSAEL